MNRFFISRYFAPLVGNAKTLGQARGLVMTAIVFTIDLTEHSFKINASFGHHVSPGLA